MGEKKAIVYSAEWCPWCHKAIDFLKENEVDVEVRDVAANPDYAKEVVEKSGQSGIPVVLVGDEVIVGFNQPALKKALGLEEEKKEEPEGKEEMKEKEPEGEEKQEEETKEG